MTRTAVLVVNPTAGAGRALAARQAVMDALRANGWVVRPTVSRDANDAVRIAAEAAPDDVVVSLGGDGMHALVARGVAAGGACLAPLPGGRGNDFVRALGLPLDPAQAALALAVGRERRIGLGEAGGRTFLGVLSVGFSALASELAASSRVRGPFAYHAAAVRALAHIAPQHYRLTVDGVSRDWSGYELAIGHSGWYGGGLQVCPGADLTDDLLDVTAIGGHKWAFPRVIGGMFSGRHIRLATVRTCRVRQIDVALAQEDAPGAVRQVWADGDYLGELPITVRVRPYCVRLLA